MISCKCNIWEVYIRYPAENKTGPIFLSYHTFCFYWLKNLMKTLGIIQSFLFIAKGNNTIESFWWCTCNNSINIENTSANLHVLLVSGTQVVGFGSDWSVIYFTYLAHKTWICFCGWHWLGRIIFKPKVLMFPGKINITLKKFPKVGYIYPSEV